VGCLRVPSRGLGEALLRAVVQWARTQGFGAVRLWVPAHGHQAKALYSKAGFRFTGLSKRVEGDTPFVASEMHLDLGACEHDA